MTPTHLSMSHEGKEILRKMTEGLDESEIRCVMLSAKQMLSISAYVAAVEKERDRLRAALEPFANAANRYTNLVLGEDIDHWPCKAGDVTLGHLRAARDTLASEEGGR